MNITLNITGGSVIEKAYFVTKKYSIPEWDRLAKLLKELKSNLNKDRKGATPRIHLDVEVLKGLEAYQKKFMKLNSFAGAKRGGIWAM